MSTARQHNPEVCGLAVDADCPHCLAASLRLEQLRNPRAAAECRLEQILREHPELRDRSQRLGSGHPAPLSSAVVGQLVATLLQPEHRAVLQDVLLELLAEPIGEIVRTILTARAAVYHREEVA